MIDLEAALSRLLPIERELLMLVHVLDLPQSSAATLLGISLRSVNRRIRQALEEYARQLSQ
jgi:DNA-directed RNA polymerase specialized sigma24 family protein